MWYASSCGRIELKMTRKQAESASHSGSCDESVKRLSEVPAIKRQLDKIDPETLRKELAGFGCWEPEDLADHAQNIQRILWIACGDIADSI